MSRFEFIKKWSLEYPVIQLCSFCGVERSSYYEWLNRKEPKADLELETEIRSIFSRSRETYGAIRVTRALKSKGRFVNKKRVARLMAKNGLKSVHKRKFKACTTDSKHSSPVADNILSQDFRASGANQKWASDITYIKTDEGFLYLAVVIDLFSRRVIGWSTGKSLETDLCLGALKMALARRAKPKELIHHSDRGSQYCSLAYLDLLKKYGIQASMSRKGNCYDNAVVESFFHTLKVECVYQTKFGSRSQARREIADYIENFYNCWRQHSTLDYMNPCEFENFRLAA